MSSPLMNCCQSSKIFYSKHLLSLQLYILNIKFTPLTQPAFQKMSLLNRFMKWFITDENWSKIHLLSHYKMYLPSKSKSAKNSSNHFSYREKFAQKFNLMRQPIAVCTWNCIYFIFLNCEQQYVRYVLRTWKFCNFNDITNYFTPCHALIFMHFTNCFRIFFLEPSQKYWENGGIPWVQKERRNIRI